MSKIEIKLDENVEEMTEQKLTLKDRMKRIWENNKDKIILGGIFGLTLLGSGIAAYCQILDNRKFDKEVQDRFGPNVIHGSWLGGSAKKRRADLEVWEKGDRKSEFDRVVEFAKTLNLGPDDYYMIETVWPDKDHTAIEVTQSHGMMFHGDWFTT